MIAVDWGTSSLRAFRLGAGGRVLDTRRSRQGMLAASGRFVETLRETTAGWGDRFIVMAGMIGSRQGWVEVPYVECPAGLVEVARAMRRVGADEFPQQEIWIVPGLSTRQPNGIYDVMRGEETQVFGLLDELGDVAATLQVCLPGTHSKHVEVEHGKVTRFATAMTGEMFALLCEHSLLGRLMQPGSHDSAAFAAGVAYAAEPGDLLRHLFAVRTQGLFGTLQSTQLHSYLSGLLIGHELNDYSNTDATVHLVGDDILVERYHEAFALRRTGTLAHSEVAVARGLYALARARGLSSA